MGPKKSPLTCLEKHIVYNTVYTIPIVTEFLFNAKPLIEVHIAAKGVNRMIAKIKVIMKLNARFKCKKCSTISYKVGPQYARIPT